MSEGKFPCVLAHSIIQSQNMHMRSKIRRLLCCADWHSFSSLVFSNACTIFCFITKTYFYNFDPLKAHFYVVKLGFTGVCIFFSFLLKNIDYGYSLEPPRRGGSNEYPQSIFCEEMWKISKFLSEIFQFLEVKFPLYLNRRIFIMIFWMS